MRLSENEVVNAVVNKLESLSLCVYREVPNLGQSVDLAHVRDEELTFIEVKVSDWKRALQQCKNHTLVADYIWIAVATKNLSSVLVDVATKLGFGLMHYRDGNVHNVLDPRKNERAWKPQRMTVLSYLNNKHHEHSTLDDVRNVC